MAFRLGIAQAGFPGDGGVLPQIDRLACEASREGVALLAFPENLMCPKELGAQELAELAEPLDGPFVHGICDTARAHGLWVVATMSEKSMREKPPYNTALVVDDSGAVRGTYRKCHLYDAHGVCESDRMTAGDAPCMPVRTPFCTLGVGICYDLRFPEVARSLALCGCDVLLFPAAWHDGPGKALHWRTLLCARAIENECFVAGVCHGGSRYVGMSHVFGPLGDVLVEGRDELLVCDVDLRAVRSAREAMPVLAHRRPDLYAELSHGA